jgi:hypothetical protein
MVVNVDDVDGLITAPTSLSFGPFYDSRGDLDDARKPGPKAEPRGRRRVGISIDSSRSLHSDTEQDV